MPLYVLYQLVPIWLRANDVNLATIGLFSLIAVPYTWKFLWSPLMDRYQPPLGRRRGWALITQIALLISLAAFSTLDPARSVSSVAVICAIVALFSASQDIALDAHRREILPDVELGIGNSMFVNAYRLSSLVPGSLALILADTMSWAHVHLIVAAFMLVGIGTTLLMPEPKVLGQKPSRFTDAIVDPFKEFFSRNGTRSACLVLVFMLLYKLGDSMATALATPFYLDLGFTMTEIGTIAKAAALWSSITGGIIGGIIMIRLGINRSLWMFGVIQLVSILGFAAISHRHAVLSVIEHRNQAPFTTVDELMDVSKLSVSSYAMIEPWLAVTSDGLSHVPADRDTKDLTTLLPDINTISKKAIERHFEDNPEIGQSIIQYRSEHPIRRSDSRFSTTYHTLIDPHFSFKTNLNTTNPKYLANHPWVSQEWAEAIVKQRTHQLILPGDRLPANTHADFDLSLFTFHIDLNAAKAQHLALLKPFIPSRWWLFFVVSFEYLGVGLGTAAFVAFIARSTNKRYTATQFALLTSLTGIPRTFANATTGFIIEAIGYAEFFLLCTAIAIPGMVLLRWVAPWGPDPVNGDEEATQ